MSAQRRIRVEGMHCASCGLLIDDALEELDGVDRAESHVRRGVTEIWLDPDRVSVNHLEAVITDLGYRARLEPGDTES